MLVLTICNKKIPITNPLAHTLFPILFCPPLKTASHCYLVISFKDLEKISVARKLGFSGEIVPL